MADLELSPVAVRIKQFIDYLQVSNSQFADEAGIPRPTLSQLLHGRNKSVNDLLLQKLHDAFPQLNLMWLLFGNGSMVQDVNSNGNSTPQSTDKTVNSADRNTTSSAGEGLFTYLVSPDDSAPSSASRDPKIVKAVPMQNEKNDSGTASDTRRVKSIIVYYTDNSFQTFYPE